MEDSAEKKSSSSSAASSLYSSTGTTKEECERMIQKSLRSPTVKFLREHLEKAGCSVNRNFFKAIECDKQIGGGYLREEGFAVSCYYHLRRECQALGPRIFCSGEPINPKVQGGMTRWMPTKENDSITVASSFLDFGMQ